MKKHILLLSVSILLLFGTACAKPAEMKPQDLETVLFPAYIKERYASISQAFFDEALSSLPGTLIKFLASEHTGLTAAENQAVKKTAENFVSDIRKQVDSSQTVNKIMNNVFRSAATECNPFTENELKNLNRFRQTPEGRSIAAKQQQYQAMRLPSVAKRLAGQSLSEKTPHNDEWRKWLDLPESALTPQEKTASVNFYSHPDNRMIPVKSRQLEICLGKTGGKTIAKEFKALLHSHKSTLLDAVEKVLAK